MKVKCVVLQQLAWSPRKLGHRAAGSSPWHCGLRTTGEEPGKVDEALPGFPGEMKPFGQKAELLNKNN